MTTEPLVQRVSSLIHGVSRQADSVRYPGQVQEAMNVRFTVTNGATRRPPSEAAAFLSDSALDPNLTYQMHRIERDETLEFLLVYSDGGGFWAIYDIGNSEWATEGSGLTYGSSQVRDYLSEDGPQAREFKLVTVADSTFIVNTRVATGTVDGGAGIDHTRMPVRLLRTSASSPYTWTIDFLVDENGDSLFKARPFHEQYLTFDDEPTGGKFKISCPWSGAGSADEKTTIFIKHDADSKDVQEALQGNGKDPDDYDDAIVGMKAFPYGKVICTGGPVHKKTVKINISTDIDADALLSVVNNSTGQTGRIKRGSDDTNPAPKFIREGFPITDVGYHRNRLAFSSEEFVAFSQTDDIFNFYLDSAAQIIDSDPIVAQLSANDITLTEFIVPFRNSLMIMTSAGQQFELSTGGLPLTPENASITPSTRYETQAVRPIAVGDRLYFLGAGQEFSVLYEYFFDDAAVSNKAANISQHVGEWLPTNMKRIVANSNSETVFCLPGLFGDTSGESYTSAGLGTSISPAQWSVAANWIDDSTGSAATVAPQPADAATIAAGDYIYFDGYDTPPPPRREMTGTNDARIYIYQSYQEGQQRKQSAWTYWSYEADALMDVALIDSDMWILRRESSEGNTVLYLDRSDISGADGLADSGFTYQVHIDRRYVMDGGTFNESENNKMKWDMGRNTQMGTDGTYRDLYVDTIVCSQDVTTATTGVTYPAGTNIPAGTDTNGKYLYGPVDLDLTGYSGLYIWAGRKINSSLELSQVFFRKDNQPIVDGRTTIKKLVVEHRDSGPYSMKVSSHRNQGTGAPDRITTFSPMLGDNSIDVYGEKVLWCHGDTETTKIELTSDNPQPCKWVALEYHGQHCTKVLG